MKTITPEQITEKMRLRITHTVSKPHGSRTGGTMIHEGVVAAVMTSGNQLDSISAVIFEEDGEIDGAAVAVVDSEYRTVTIEPGEWPENTLAYANIAVDEDRLVDVLLIRKAYRWQAVENWKTYSDIDIENGQIILDHLRIIHDGRVPA